MMSHQQGGREQAQMVRGADPSRRLILLVEDDEVNARLLLQIITQETPYQVAHASDGKTAWKFLQHVKPQLVILDYRLPHMNGMELYKRIRAHKELHDLPVLLLSAALPSRETRQDGLVSLRKPFDLDEFLDTLDALLPYQQDQLM